MSLPRLVVFLALAISSLCVAQRPSDTATPPESKNPFQNLRFRNLGPAVAGGRISSVVGIPGNPKLYYAGSAGGGIFKSEDGGQSWKPIFEHEATSSIGAIALAPSNSNLIWVGTGEPNLRNDITTGHGVYFSPDAGATWQFKGLADAGQIANVIVNAHDPNIVLVGAVGHAWGPNSERGVFRSTDAGKTWQKVLYLDDKTGVSDMAVDPTNPMVVYAGMWTIQRTPWEMVSGGTTGGIYRSLDDGATWKKLSDGLPHGVIGRVGLAIAPSNPRHIY
ncbi:MAG: glycosyl hydrolase, partial [Acidobacteriaceae bacterium]